MKRIAIYAFYDAQQRVDRYVPYLLQDLKENVEKIIVVVNGTIEPEEKKKFFPMADQVMERENSGLDIWGYREGLLSIGWDALSEYDEVVLLNNTVYGPVYPFSEMFSDMETKELDFWGITRHSRLVEKTKDGEESVVPEHIQSYFMVFRKRLMENLEVQQYWENLPLFQNYEEAVYLHEIPFTERMVKLGFRWDVYMRVPDLEEKNAYPLLFYPKDLVERGCPIIKRRIFFHDYDYIRQKGGGQAKELWEYLEKEKSCLMDLIWENLLGTCNRDALARHLQWNKIITKKSSDGDCKLKWTTISLQDSTEEIWEAIQAYDVICITSRSKEDEASGVYAKRHICEDQEYMNACVTTFEKDVRLGLLTASVPCFGDAYEELAKMQGNDRDAVCNDAAFWVRTEAIRGKLQKSDLDRARSQGGIVNLCMDYAFQNQYYTAMAYNELFLDEELMDRVELQNQAYRQSCEREAVSAEWQKLAVENEKLNQRYLEQLNANKQMLEEWNKSVTENTELNKRFVDLLQTHEQVCAEWKKVADELERYREREKKKRFFRRNS